MLHSYKTGKPYPGVMPSTKAVKRLKKNIHHQRHRANVDPIEEVVIRLNRALRGWANYFRYGSVLRVRQKLDRLVFDRVRYFLARRAKCPTRGTRRFPRTYIFGQLGVVSLNALPRADS